MQVEETPMDENEDVITSLGILDLEDGNNRLLVHFISCYFYFSSIYFLKFDACVCQSCIQFVVLFGCHRSCPSDYSIGLHPRNWIWCT